MMKNLIQFDGFLRYSTLVFGIINVGCGIPITLGLGGLVSARSFVPTIMSQNFDSCGISLKPQKLDFEYYAGNGRDESANAISGAERLYDIIFGLLATLLGIIRLVAFIYWNDPDADDTMNPPTTMTTPSSTYKPSTTRSIMRLLTIVTYCIEVIRDSIMMIEGYIQLNEAVAFIPALAFAICMILLEYMESNEYRNYNNMIRKMKYNKRD